MTFAAVADWYRQHDPAFARCLRASSAIAAILGSGLVLALAARQTGVPYTLPLSISAGLSAFFTGLFYRLPVALGQWRNMALFMLPILVVSALTARIGGRELEIEAGFILAVFLGFYVRRFPEPWPGAGLAWMMIYTGHLMAPEDAVPMIWQLAASLVGMIAAFAARRLIPVPAPDRVFTIAGTDACRVAARAVEAMLPLLNDSRDAAALKGFAAATKALDDEERRLAQFVGLGPTAEPRRQRLAAFHDLSQALVLVAEIVTFDSHLQGMPKEARWGAAEAAEIAAVLTALSRKLQGDPAEGDWEYLLAEGRRAQTRRVGVAQPEWAFVLALRALSAMQVLGLAIDKVRARW